MLKIVVIIELRPSSEQFDYQLSVSLCKRFLIEIILLYFVSFVSKSAVIVFIIVLFDLDLVDT